MKTLYSFQTQGVRLQLVEDYGHVYRIFLNRKLEFQSKMIDVSKYQFNGYVKQYLFQGDIFRN